MEHECLYVTFIVMLNKADCANVISSFSVSIMIGQYYELNGRAVYDLRIFVRQLGWATWHKIR